MQSILLLTDLSTHKVQDKDLIDTLKSVNPTGFRAQLQLTQNLITCALNLTRSRLNQTESEVREIVTWWLHLLTSPNYRNLLLQMAWDITRVNTLSAKPQGETTQWACAEAPQKMPGKLLSRIKGLPHPNIQGSLVLLNRSMKNMFCLKLADKGRENSPLRIMLKRNS